MPDLDELYCYYSDLPSPMAYMEEDVQQPPILPPVLTDADIDRIIEMAWEDRTPFDAIRFQFGLTESQVRKLMKDQLKFSSYKNWRKRVEACTTKHQAKRNSDINRFKCSRQRTITLNKISKKKY